MNLNAFLMNLHISTYKLLARNIISDISIQIRSITVPVWPGSTGKDLVYRLAPTVGLPALDLWCPVHWSPPQSTGRLDPSHRDPMVDADGGSDCVCWKWCGQLKLD